MNQYKNWKVSRKGAYLFVPRRNVIIPILGWGGIKVCLTGLWDSLCLCYMKET